MNKRIFAIAIAMCVILPVLAGAFGNVKAVSPAVLSLQSAYVPPTNVPSQDIGKTFTLKLHVDNVTNLWSWKVKLTWDPAYLSMTTDPVEGTFLNSVNGTLFLWTPYANTPGALNEVSDTSLGSLEATGSGDLATFNFTIIHHGYNSTAINLTGAVMQDFNNPIAFSVVDASVRNTVPGDVASSTPGVPDGLVNMRDIAYMVSLFNTKPSSPNWNPNADVNGDGVVNMKDIATGVAHFNQHV